MTAENKQHTASWSDNIDKAMKQIDRPNPAQSSRGFSITLPRWVPYGAFLVLGIQVSHYWVADDMPHPIANDHDYATGARVSLLMVAEDIERARDVSGELPDSIPGGLGLALAVKYEKADDGHYLLTYNDGDKHVVFDGRLRQFGLDTEG